MIDTLLIAFSLYFFLVLALSFLKPRYVPGRAIYLFRALFPSWRFYEEVCEVPMLYIRSGTETELGDWHPAWKPLERSLRKIFLNPEI